MRSATIERHRPFRLMAVEVFEVNEANGWFEDDRTIGDDVALLHSEVSEALEAYRAWGYDDMTGHPAAPGALPKPEGVGSELADVLIRLLDTIYRRDVVPAWLDLTLAKVPAHRIHGATSFGDVIAILHGVIARGDLNGLLPHLVGAAEFAGVDLAAEYARKLAFNRTRGHRHGGKRL